MPDREPRPFGPPMPPQEGVPVDEIPVVYTSALECTEHDWREWFRGRAFTVIERCHRCDATQVRDDPPYVPDWAVPKEKFRGEE